MRHIVPLSGKDSAALAFLLRKLYPERVFEYIMTPVADREPEELIPWLQDVAGRCGGELQLITTTTFTDLLDKWGGMLPSPRVRWCTRALKIEPFEKHVQGHECTIYLGLRNDEDRDGNTGEKQGLIYEYPLRDHEVDQCGALLLIAEGFGVDVPPDASENDLWPLLIEVGALPRFYEWLSHANCYGCIFWNVTMWRKLYERMPEKYWTFSAQESVGSNFTYVHGWTLAQLAQRFELELAGFRMGPRQKKRNGAAQMKLDVELLDKPMPEENPWEKPCAVCRIGG